MADQALVIRRRDLDAVLDGLRRAEGYAKFGKGGVGAAVAAGILSAHREHLAVAVARKCITSTCTLPSTGDDGWCDECAERDDDRDDLQSIEDSAGLHADWTASAREGW